VKSVYEIKISLGRYEKRKFPSGTRPVKMANLFDIRFKSNLWREIFVKGNFCSELQLTFPEMICVFIIYFMEMKSCRNNVQMFDNYNRHFHATFRSSRVNTGRRVHWRF